MFCWRSGGVVDIAADLAGDVVFRGGCAAVGEGEEGKGCDEEFLEHGFG